MKKSYKHYLKTGRLAIGHFLRNEDYAVWRPEGTRDFQLIYTIAGRGLFKGESDITVKQGDAVLIPPKSLHHYGTSPLKKRWEFVWVHFDLLRDWNAWVNWPEVHPGLMHLTVGETSKRRLVTQSLLEACQFALSSREHMRALAQNCFERVLLELHGVNPLAEEKHLDTRLQNAMDYVDSHLQHPISIAQLAQRANLSPSRFSHHFSETLGITPQQHIEQQRLNRACELLKFTNEPIKQIAAEIGFACPFYFSLRFKKFAGVSPTQFRKKLW